MKLSPNFYLEEFTQSDYALRHGIKNIPSPNVTQNLMALASGLEHVRDLLKHPISITSGYRCLELNRAIRGSGKSAHMLGYAADFKCYGFGSPEQITQAIKNSEIIYDQLICEGAWVHISFEPQYRQQTLRALFDERGRATYKAFI